MAYQLWVHLKKSNLVLTELWSAQLLPVVDTSECTVNDISPKVILEQPLLLSHLWHVSEYDGLEVWMPFTGKIFLSKCLGTSEFVLNYLENRDRQYIPSDLLYLISVIIYFKNIFSWLSLSWSFFLLISIKSFPGKPISPNGSELVHPAPGCEFEFCSVYT